MSDYPWGELGEATVVDVGGGVGKPFSLLLYFPAPFLHPRVSQVRLSNQWISSSQTGGLDIQLSHLYPNLNFIIQDRGPVLQQAEHSVWPLENPAALAAGRVKFMQHDFFSPNPVRGAAVYWLRYIL